MSYSIAVDRKWQKRWEEEKLASFNWDRIGNKLYVLEMFSYPSGANLHVGHWYNYALSDTWARMKKMRGYEVFQPMGFDAFGLPAENYAIKTGIHPQDSTLKNIHTMEKQLREMGGMFNWDHELATCMPDYYRWNQWLFLQLYKNGLAYRKNAPVNWCPACNTVLANEQVEADHTCERCHTEVIKKNLTQWFFKITDYAQQLLDDLDQLDWPERTKKIQINWIGRSEGAQLSFGAEKDGETVLAENGEPLKLDVFTTRADTLMGVTYVVVAPESEICDLLTTDAARERVKAYQAQTSKTTEIDRLSTTREKTGVFTGSYAIHPVTGVRVPIWTSDYVIASYGTGIVMAVPGHDERDYEFATAFDLPIKRVINLPDGSESELPYCEYGVLVNSGEYDGLASKEGIRRIVSDLADRQLGSFQVNYRLRDWLVSRQRYWGTPIPMIYCDDCGVVPVPEDQLPVELPYEVDFTPDGDSPLKKSTAFMQTTCPCCGGPATRDPDTLDTFVCSSWYQFRYVDNRNDREAFDRDLVNQMCPVDQYIGGAEHAAMHLLYARFITKALRDMGYLNFDEPFISLVHQGTILGPDGQKMSKSLGNTISPDDYIAKYGSDVFRLYLAFGFAYTDGGPWSDESLKAITKFTGRIERLVTEILKRATDAYGAETAAIWATDASFDPWSGKLGEAEKDLNYARHYAIKAVSEDAERFQFNTSIARMMEWLTALQTYAAKPQSSVEILYATVGEFIRVLAPFAPHFCEELWEQLGHSGVRQGVFYQNWPTFDPKALKLDRVEIAIQINGQLKSRLMIEREAKPDEVEAQVRNLAEFAVWTKDKEVRKVIYVPGRIINIVAK